MVEIDNIVNRNLAIAKLIGWFQEEDQPETWFEFYYENGAPTAKYVAFSTYKSHFRGELPFRTDLNYLYKALEIILKMEPAHSTEVGKYWLNNLVFNENGFSGVLGKNALNDDRGFEPLFVIRKVSLNMSWRDALYLFISDIALQIEEWER